MEPPRRVRVALARKKSDLDDFDGACPVMAKAEVSFLPVLARHPRGGSIFDFRLRPGEGGEGAAGVGEGVQNMFLDVLDALHILFVPF